MNNIYILLLVFMVLIIFNLLKVAIDTTKNVGKITKYNRSAISITVLVLLTLHNIILYNILNKFLDEIFSLLIVLFASNLIILLVTVLFMPLVVKKPLGIISGLSFLIKFMTIILYPILFIYIGFKHLLVKNNDSLITEEDVISLLEKAKQDGNISESENSLIKKVLDFDELKILDIYTPRTDVVAIEKNESFKDITKAFYDSGYSRLPVYEESLDDIIGIINHKDFYNKVLLKKKTLKSIIQKPAEVTEYMDLTDLLAFFKTTKNHMAIVKDEFGGTLGIVTLEDVLEELVGDIFDEHDQVLTNVKSIGTEKYLVLGSSYLEELEPIIDVKELEDEDYLTVNGWVLSNLGKMANVGDNFVYKNALIKVTNTDSKKILEVEITLFEEKSDKEEN